MDVLLNIVQQKKKDVAELKASRNTKWISGKVVKEKERSDALKSLAESEEKQKQQEIKKLKELDTFLNTNSKRPPKDDHSKDDQPTKKRKIEEEEEGEPPVGKNEVVKRLRRRGQVVTYFGETEWMRYKRLCEIELTEHGDELAGGQHNLFLKLLDEHNSSPAKRDDNPYRRRVSDVEMYDDDFEDGRNIDSKEVEKKEMSKSDHVRAWIRRMLNEWECELQQRTEEERSSAIGKIKTAQCKQTRKDLRPLMKKLKHDDLDEAVLDKLHSIVVLCEAQDYKKSHDKYIELSIGNAAWPMGVTMVGIHERAGRSKIFTSEIAHVLNDETTRKYIHMFKRLISFCQRKYPTDPSKMLTLLITKPIRIQ